MKHKPDEEVRLPVFRDRLDFLRAGRSNTEFAEFLGMSRQTVGFYLNGNRLPDVLSLRQIAEKCGVSADWLLGMSNFKEPVGEVSQVCNYTGLSPNSIRQLHYLNSLDDPLKVSLWLLDEILEKSILDFRTDAWRCAVAGVYDKTSEELADRMGELDKELLTGALNGDKASTNLKFPVLGIENLSYISAIDGIKKAAERVLDAYRKKFYDVFLEERDHRKE